MRAPCCVAFALALAACASSDVNGRDKDRLFPMARVVLDLDEPRGEPGEPPYRDSHRRFRQGLELEVSGTAGDFVLDNGVGPTDYTVVHGSAAYRAGFAGSRVQGFGLVGLAIDRIDLSGNALATNDESFFGPMFGFEGRLRVRDWFSPYLRLTGFLMEQGSFAEQFETGVVFTPGERFEGFVAFRRWEAEYGDAAPFGRDLQLEWRGLVLGFGVRL